MATGSRKFTSLSRHRNVKLGVWDIVGYRWIGGKKGTNLGEGYPKATAPGWYAKILGRAKSSKAAEKLQKKIAKELWG